MVMAIGKYAGSLLLQSNLVHFIREMIFLLTVANEYHGHQFIPCKCELHK